MLPSTNIRLSSGVPSVNPEVAISQSWELENSLETPLSGYPSQNEWYYILLLQMSLIERDFITMLFNISQFSPDG